MVSEFWSKRAKKRQKKGYFLKKNLICDSANPLIKNQTPHRFQHFDKVFKKKKFFCFSPKMAICRMVSEKCSKFRPFLISKGYKKGQKFLAGKKKFSKIGQGVYLQPHRTLNPQVRYLGKILKFVRGRKGLFPPPIFLIAIILKKI